MGALAPKLGILLCQLDVIVNGVRMGFSQPIEVTFVRCVRTLTGFLPSHNLPLDGFL